MRVRVDGEWRETDALDLRERTTDHDRGAVRDAIEGDADWLACPSPGDLWNHVGCVAPEVPVSTRAALAAAARSRGRRAPQDDRRRAVLARRAAIEVEHVETAPLRRQLAAANEETDRLRERVARLQGRVQAARDAPAAAEGSDEEELAAAIRHLSERETDRAAARQALDRARRRQRAARDAREERRRLADRAANLARTARRELAARMDAEFRAAVATLPASRVPDDPFEAGPVTRALAVARVGDPRAPLVLGCDRFPSARAAADWLDAPVVRL